MIRLELIKHFFMFPEHLGGDIQSFYENQMLTTLPHR